VSSFLTSEAPFVLFEFLKKRIGISWSEDLRTIGRVEGKVLTGVVGFNNITGTSCQMHFAGDVVGWLTRTVLRESFSYAFKTLKCRVVYASVPSGNKEALDIDRRIGFKDVIFLPDAHPDGGIYLLQMTRGECKWLQLGERHGRKIIT